MIRIVIAFGVFCFGIFLEAQNFPQVHQVVINEKSQLDVKKVIVDKEKTQLLVMNRNSLYLKDAQTFKTIQEIDFKEIAWDCAFVENGFVLLTNRSFTHFDTTGTKVLYKARDKDIGQIYKMDIQENGYIVNMIKHIEKPTAGKFFYTKGLTSFNLRTQKYSTIKYRSNPKKKEYLYDVDDELLKFKTNGGLHYRYINILTGNEVNKSNTSNKILNLEDVEFYNSLYREYKLGCISPDKNRYAIFENKKTLKVYDKKFDEAIFTLPNISGDFAQKDCLIYNDSLVLKGKQLEIYDLVKDKYIYENLDTSVEVMPIIGSCVGKKYGLSLWVSTMYGWDLEYGKMLWYTKEPEFYRSHWENASYLIKLLGDDKSALVKPFGKRAFDEELKVNLESGLYENYEATQKLDNEHIFKVCNPNPDGWIPKKNSFTHKGLKFYVVNKGDWLVIDPKDGYFNVSSQRVISLLSKNYRYLSEEDIAKWYRPDIIEAKLRGKSFENLKSQKISFTLSEESKLKNQYLNTLIRQIQDDKAYMKVRKYIKKMTMNEIKALYELVKKDNTAKTYFKFYSALTHNKITKLYSKHLKKRYIPNKYKNEVVV